MHYGKKKKRGTLNQTSSFVEFFKDVMMEAHADDLFSFYLFYINQGIFFVPFIDGQMFQLKRDRHNSAWIFTPFSPINESFPNYMAFSLYFLLLCLSACLSLYLSIVFLSPFSLSFFPLSLSHLKHLRNFRVYLFWWVSLDRYISVGRDGDSRTR